MNPTLDGTCTAAAGAVACVSGVCDTNDSRCGFANGDGPCTVGDGGNGSAVCRSNVCTSSGANSGLCEACNTNRDCPTGEICSANNACVTSASDAGPGIDGGSPGVDASAEDSGVEDAGQDASADASSAADASPTGDATAEASEDTGVDANANAGVDASDNGFVEGGGCSSTGGRGRDGGTRGTLLGGISILGALAARRRRARRERC
jgi:hypothetical protein